MRLPILILGLFIPFCAFAQQTKPSNVFGRTRISSDAALTADERVQVLIKNNFLSVGAVMRAVGPAIGGQFGNTPPDWGRTAEGFGRRVGTQFAIQTTRGLVSGGSAAMLGRDPRYQRCNCEGVFRRMGQSFSGLVMGADASGARRFDPSNMMGAYTGGYVGASLYPDRYRISVKGYQLGTQQAGQVVVQNLLLEFGPDIKRFFKTKVLRR
jgi:hypothetical protein